METKIQTDLCFISLNNNGCALPTTLKVTNDFSHIQYRQGGILKKRIATNVYLGHTVEPISQSGT